MDDLEDLECKIKKLRNRLENIRILCDFFTGHHPPTCDGWEIFNHKIIFEGDRCNCCVSDILHEIEMAKDYIC